MDKNRRSVDRIDTIRVKTGLSLEARQQELSIGSTRVNEEDVDWIDEPKKNVDWIDEPVELGVPGKRSNEGLELGARQAK